MCVFVFVFCVCVCVCICFYIYMCVCVCVFECVCVFDCVCLCLCLFDPNTPKASNSNPTSCDCFLHKFSKLGPFKSNYPMKTYEAIILLGLLTILAFEMSKS